MQPAPGAVGADDPHAGVDERGHGALAIYDGEVDRPDTVRGRVNARRLPNSSTSLGWCGSNSRMSARPEPCTRQACSPRDSTGTAISARERVLDHRARPAFDRRGEELLEGRDRGGVPVRRPAG